MAITTDKNYPRIYDGNGNLVAILEQAKNVMLTEQLNGSCTLKFLLPRNDPKWEYITDAYYLRVEGKEFALVGTDEERDNTGKLITNVQYEENYLELAGYVGDYLTVEILNTDAGSALTSLLFGKPWSVGQVTVPNTRLRDLVTEKESLLFNLRKVQELWGGYLVFDSINRSVSLFETYGQDNGVQFRYRKNLKSVRKTTDFAGVVTRLYPFGKDGLDISSVEPGGKNYIENFNYTNRVREGIWVDQQYTDATKLYEAAQEVLAEIAQPRVSYAVSIVDLSHLTGYEHESFKLGDWVTVIDEELGINVKAQIVKRTYDVLQPWRGSVELANFRPGITDLITEAVKSSRIVGQAVLPNKKISTNALQGYINTATNQINSPNSRLKWDETGIIAEEVDEQGQPTGKIVKITSGGVGISNDGGQTFHVAMTGDGVLANRVVVNDIYALSTEDGFTKMKAAGIEVWDNSNPPKKRVHLGQYEAGKFGLEVRAQDGQTVLLDEQGMLQTWQDSKADNLDSSNPLLLNLYLPPETRSIKRALLRFKLLAFRAYETGAASGGGTTSGPSSRDTTVSGKENLEITDYVIPPGSQPLVDYVQSDGGHSHGLSDDFPSGTHNHGNPDYVGTGQHSHSLSIDSVGNHTHWLYNHYHAATINGHSHGMDHNHSIPNHTHRLVFGIYTSTVASGVTVKINGTDRTADLGGPFDTDQESLDISPYLTIGQFNTIELGSSQLGRIDATVFIQALMGV